MKKYRYLIILLFDSCWILYGSKKESSRGKEKIPYVELGKSLGEDFKTKLSNGDHLFVSVFPLKRC